VHQPLFTMLLTSLLSACLWLSPVATSAATYHVRQEGGGDCPTPQPCIERLQPGDTLYLHGGTYSITVRNVPSGTSSARVTIAGAPGETAIIKPAFNGAGQGALIDVTAAYVTFDNLVVDGATYCGDGATNLFKLQSSSHHVRISNSILRNCRSWDSTSIPTSAAKPILLTPSSTNNEFINLELTNNLGYGMYINSSNNLVEGCNIHGGSAFGIHIYDDGGNVNNNIVRNNRIWNNGDHTYTDRGSGCSGGCYQAGILLSSGTGNTAYNNLVYNNEGGRIQADGSNMRIYNNTIYGNKREPCIFGGGDGEIRNNICANNAGGISVSGGGTQTNNLTSDPGLVNPATGDFHLSAGATAAIKAGVDLSRIFTTDFAGAQRPAGAFDLGAYASGSGGTAIPAPNNLRLIGTPSEGTR
jgi:parallel beta-helix repeat protein